MRAFRFGARGWREAAVALFFASLLAGCSEDGSVKGSVLTQVPIESTTQGPGLFIDGQVLDEEMLPVEGATVVATPGDHAGTTDEAGRFHIGPVEAGRYTLIVTKDSFRPATAEARVGDAPEDGPTFVLERIPTQVPFRETHTFAGYLWCYWSFGPSWECIMLDSVTGDDYTEDTSQFDFQIPYAGLVDILAECMWEDQLTARNLWFRILPHGQGFTLTAGTNTVTYVSLNSGNPMREWVVVGVENRGGNDVFDGTKDLWYTSHIGAQSNFTRGDAVQLAVDMRVDCYYTFFFHAAGDRNFSALPP